MAKETALTSYWCCIGVSLDQLVKTNNLLQASSYVQASLFAYLAVQCEQRHYHRVACQYPPIHLWESGVFMFEHGLHPSQQ